MQKHMHIFRPSLKQLLSLAKPVGEVVLYSLNTVAVLEFEKSPSLKIKNKIIISDLWTKHMHI